MAENQIYKVRDPQGVIREISGPPGASDADVIAQAQRLIGAEAPAPIGEVPGPRKEPGIYERFVRPVLAPTLEVGGAIGGGLIGAGAGTLAGPVGTATGAVAGAGLGYGIGKEALNLADVYIGGKPARQGAAQVTEPIRNVLEGAAYEAGGRVAAPLIAKGIGKLVDLKQIPIQKAASIARNALGPDLPEALNALQAAKGGGVSAAQATADINSPTWQALIDRAVARDPRFLIALEKSQGEVSINALASLAKGTTATEVRATTDIAKKNLNTITSPMRDTALNRANLGKAVAEYEAQAGKLGAEATAEVQSVRDLVNAGKVAEAAARLEVVKKGIPVGYAKYTYPGELAIKADEWASKAATGSLDLGQGARFNQAAADTLRAHGIQPLEGAVLARDLGAVQRNPEYAGNDLLSGAVKNLTGDITQWTSKGGIIDARALDAIRKNSVNATIQQLRPGVDATTQRNLAAGVLSKLKPVIDDAIVNAGGVGYKEYLARHAQGMQAIAEKQLTGEALNLWKTDKDAFVRLVQGESPEAVEKVLGPGRYDIAKELSDNAITVMQDQAAKRLRELNVKGQVSAGQDALKELLLQNVSKFRLPSYLSALTSTTNKALGILETRLGRATMNTLAKGLQTPEGAANLLSTLPASERTRVLSILSNPAQWSAPTGAAVTGTANVVGNALTPSESRNALVEAQ